MGGVEVDYFLAKSSDFIESLFLPEHTLVCCFQLLPMDSNAMIILHIICILKNSIPLLIPLPSGL